MSRVLSAVVDRPPGGEDQAARLRALVDAAAARERPPEPARAERRARVISISSGKGGVGKTNLCVNVAIALAAAGKRVTLLDADLGLANADVLCGLTPGKRLDRLLGVSDAGASGGGRGGWGGGGAAGRSGLSEIVVEAPGGFRLVPGASGVSRMADLGDLERARLLAIVAELEREADLLLIDTAAGLGASVLGLMRAADLAIVVATPEPTSIADAYALIKCAASRGGGGQGNGAGVWREARVGLVVNQSRDEGEGRAVHARISGVCQRFLGFGVPLLGQVAMDGRVPQAVRRRVPVMIDAPRCEASRGIRALGEGLVCALAAEAAPKLREGLWGLSGAISRLVLRSK
jgi:flagellar biosynthesis protein FlhG